MSKTNVETGTIEHLDPNTLVIEANVRPSAPLTSHFIQSIRQNGVLTPVLAHRDTNGNVLVRAGQRRTLAAREAGLTSIPVYLVDADEATTERIVQQMVENDQREALTDGQRAAAFQQLAFEGLSAATIAKRTSTKPKEVKIALAVAENATAVSAIHEHPLTLDQAATLIEFDDSPDVVAALIETAAKDPARFEHEAQRARDERARAQVQAEAVADLTARGYTILEREVYYGEPGPINLNALRTADGERVSMEQLETIEGRCAHVGKPYYAGDHARVTYYLDVDAAKTAGYRKEGAAAAGPMTDEQKAERRTLIANNKAWDSAQAVRREWLTALLTRKTLPKDTATVIAMGLTTHRRPVGDALGRGNSLAHEFLGVENAGWGASNKLATLVENTPTKALHVALAAILGGIEDSTSRNTWRYPTTEDRAYFTQLAAWGYPLSEVEQIITGEDEPQEQPAD